MLLLAPSKGQTFAAVDPYPAAFQPEFQEQSGMLIQALARLDGAALAELMQLSPALTEQTLDKIQALATDAAPARPALFAFSGEAFRSLDAASLNDADLQFAQDRFPVDSGNRRFAGSINIGQHDDIGRSKGRTELAGQQLGAGKPVRLKNTDDPAIGRCFGAMQGGQNLCRMMPIVVDNPDAMRSAFGLKSTLDAAKSGHDRSNLLKRDS